MDTKINPVKISNELEFVVALSVINVTPFQKNKVVLLYKNKLDWNEIYNIVNKNRIQPRFIKNIHTMGLMDKDNKALIMLQNEAKKYSLKSLKLASDLKEIVSVFDKYNIKVISMKGPLLAKEIYNDISMRTSNDLDILIDIKDFEAAEYALKSIGFNRPASDYRNTPKRIKGVVKGCHHLEYIKDGILVELHWRLGYFYQNDFSLLYKDAQINEFYGCDIQTLSNKDNALYLLLHGAKHGFHRLRWLFDIYEMIISGQIDVDLLYKEAVDVNMDIVLLQTLIILYSIPVFDMPETKCGGLCFSKEVITIKETINAKTKRHFNSVNKLALLAIDVINNDKDPICKGAPVSKEANRYSRHFAYIYRKQFSDIFTYLRAKIYPNHHDFEVFDFPDSLYWLYFVARPFYKLYRLVFK